jgi:hypothetical protein
LATSVIAAFSSFETGQFFLRLASQLLELRLLKTGRPARPAASGVDNAPFASEHRSGGAQSRTVQAFVDFLKHLPNMQKLWRASGLSV